MSNFRKYASYYDLLYLDKDYSAEVDYIDTLLRRYAPAARRILELGSGTGRHALLLAQKGYSLHGVDLSEDMVRIACDRQRDGAAGNSAGVSFNQGDIRDYRAGQTFDVVMALFHVVCYQTANQDIISTFRTAAAHLEEGGIFIFDCWYGPAVLTEQPERRTKAVENAALEIVRETTPELLPDSDIVDVHFDVTVREKASGIQEQFHELHRMRYLFSPEVDHFLQQSGFALQATEEWLGGGRPGTGTWNVCYVARKC
ncbi:MAG: class I SAM-dependent methyltransferase [Gammaproteobacteria bacterium]